MFLKTRASDADVVAQVLGGEREAFGLLVERYLRNVYALAYSYVRNASDSEDIVQQAFISAFQRLDTLRDPRRFCPWLIQIARNVSLDHIKKAARETTRAENETGAERSVAPDVEERELLELLRQKVAELEPDAREVLVLHYFSDLTTAEIARHLDISREAAKKRLQRARAALSERFLDNLGKALQHDPPAKINKNQIMGAVLAAGATWEAGASNATAGGAGGLFAALPMNKTVMIALLALSTLVALLYMLPGDETIDMTQPTLTAVNHPPEPEPPQEEAPLVLAQSSVEVAAEMPEAVEAVAEEEAPEELPPSSISGYVVDEFGEPVAGASIIALFEQSINEDTNLDSYRLMSQPENQYRTTADNQGRFTVSGIRHAGGARLFAEAYGTQGSAHVDVNRGNSSEIVEIVLKQGVPLLGRVLSPLGEPVPNAYVDVVATSSGGHAAEAVSNESGSFRLLWSRRLTWAHVLVRSTEGDALFENVPVGTGEVFDLHLPEPATVLGEVKFSDGKAVEGFNVSLNSKHGVSYSPEGITILGTGLSYSAVTDVMGLYEIRGVFPDSRYNIVVTNVSGIEVSPKTALGELASGQELRRDFTLDALTTIKGVVVAKSSGAPVHNVGVTVVVDPYSPPPIDRAPEALSTVVDENGAFEYQVAVAPGEYVLTPYYQHIQLSFAVEAFGESFQIDHGQTTEAELGIDAPYTISLRVVDSNEEPINAHIGTQWTHDDGRTHSSTGWQTDENGYFSWDGFAPFGAYVLSISATGYSEGKSASYEGEPGAVYPLETIVLYEYAGIEGLAVDSEGRPLALTLLKILVRYRDMSSSSVSVNTDENGYFLVGSGLPVDGSLAIKIDEPDGSSSGEWQGIRSDLEPNMIHNLGTIVFAEPPVQE